MSKRVAIYVRVSTQDQTCENQLLDLRRYAFERGWRVVQEFSDTGVSGSKASRPGLDRLMDAAKKRKIDVVLVWRFDRFARSVRHLVNALEELRNVGVAFVSYTENIDTDTPMGKAMFAIVGAMAELERNVLIERVRAGMSRAKKQGIHVGRPAIGRADADEIVTLSQRGMTQRAIAKQLGVSRSYVARAVAQRASKGADVTP